MKANWDLRVGFCERVGAWHRWHNQDGVSSAGYHCGVVREGQLWRMPGQLETSRQ